MPWTQVTSLNAMSSTPITSTAGITFVIPRNVVGATFEVPVTVPESTDGSFRVQFATISPDIKINEVSYRDDLNQVIIYGEVTAVNTPNASRILLSVGATETATNYEVRIVDL